MTIRVVLAPLAGDPSDQSVLALTLAVARRMEAHVAGVHARTHSELALLAATPEPAVITAEIMTQLQQNADERAAAAARRFAEWQKDNALATAETPAHGQLSASWREVDAPDALAQCARLADLTVIARGGDADPVPATLDAVMFRSGRPVLLAPPAAAANPFGTAIVAWNDSRESAHAVALAMPLLRAVQRIVVFAAGEDGRSPKGEALCGYLAWHGLQASALTVAPEGGDVGKALLAEAARSRAGLLVMGGYTHSRLRQVVFGGVTQHVLHHASVPVLMAH